MDDSFAERAERRAHSPALRLVEILENNRHWLGYNWREKALVHPSCDEEVVHGRENGLVQREKELVHHSCDEDIVHSRENGLIQGEKERLSCLLLYPIRCSASYDDVI